MRRLVRLRRDRVDSLRVLLGAGDVVEDPLVDALLAQRRELCIRELHPGPGLVIAPDGLVRRHALLGQRYERRDAQSYRCLGTDLRPLRSAESLEHWVPGCVALAYARRRSAARNCECGNCEDDVTHGVSLTHCLTQRPATARVDPRWRFPASLSASRLPRPYRATRRRAIRRCRWRDRRPRSRAPRNRLCAHRTRTRRRRSRSPDRI